ncbi:MAG: Crp/Fnr family transcriptional regulator [Chloroflexi bacterium]|nr:Crp/Fnr family transcriptional regulator [Chloroflexota bacterium]
MIRGFLRQTPYFAALADADLARVAGRFGERRFARGDVLFLEGEPALWAGIVQTGQVKLVKSSDAGKDLVLEVLSPGRFIGVESLLRGQVHAATGQAMEDSSILAIAYEDFMPLLADYPEMTRALAEELTGRLEDAYRMMRSLALERVERRVALNLVKLAGKLGVAGAKGSILIDLPLSRQDLADMSGTTIETAIRTMSKFQKDGLVESEEGKVRLLKPHRLVMLSEDLL